MVSRPTKVLFSVAIAHPIVSSCTSHPQILSLNLAGKLLNKPLHQLMIDHHHAGLKNLFTDLKEHDSIQLTRHNPQTPL